ARRLAHRPASKELATRIGRGHVQPFLLLPLGAEPYERHQRKAVDEQDGREARIDRSDLLGDDLQVEIGDPAAAIPLRNEPRGEAELVGFGVGSLDALESLLRIRMLIGRRNTGRENLVRELACDTLQSPLVRRRSEINRHGPLPYECCPTFQNAYARMKGDRLARLIQRIAGIQKRVLYKPLSSRHELASRLTRSPARRESRHVRPLWLSRRAPVQLSDRSSQEGRGGVRRRTDHLGRRRHAARRGGAATRDRGYTCAADLGPA